MFVSPAAACNHAGGFSDAFSFPVKALMGLFSFFLATKVYLAVAEKVIDCWLWNVFMNLQMRTSHVLRAYFKQNKPPCGADSPCRDGRGQLPAGLPVAHLDLS